MTALHGLQGTYRHMSISSREVHTQENAIESNRDPAACHPVRKSSFSFYNGHIELTGSDADLVIRQGEAPENVTYGELRDFERQFLDKALRLFEPARFIEARLWRGNLYLRVHSGAHGQQVLIIPDCATQADCMRAFALPWGGYGGPFVAIRESAVVEARE